MKQVKSIFLMLLLLLLWSCSNNNNIELSYVYTQDTLISMDTVVSGRLELYSIKQIDDKILILMKKELSPILLLYNYDYDSLHFINSFSLCEDYEKRTIYGKITSFDIISEDKVLLNQQKRISVINLKEQKIDFTFLHSQNDTDVFLRDVSQPILWNPYNNSILSYMIRYNDINKRKYEADTEFSAEIDVKTGKLRILPLKYHDAYKTSLRFASFSYPYIISSKEYYVGAFGITPDLVVLNKYTNEIKKIKIKHLNMQNVESFDTTKIKEKDYYDNHSDESINYFQIVYDPFRDLYYRFYMLPLSKERNEDGLLKTYNDKITCISVISNDFKIIGDVILSKDIFFKGWYSTSKGLMKIKFLRKSNKYVINKINVLLK